MNSRKKRRLKAKRAPWVKTRYTPRRYVWENRGRVECIDRRKLRSFLESFDFDKYRRETEAHQARVSAFIDQKLRSETKWNACMELRPSDWTAEQLARYRK